MSHTPGPWAYKLAGQGYGAVLDAAVGAARQKEGK